MTLQIQAEGIRKRYGDAYALDGFALPVPAGHACTACSGPNGAGKTTAVRILSTCCGRRRPARGRRLRRRDPTRRYGGASASSASTPPSTRC